jgi:hypothetical protein
MFEGAWQHSPKRVGGGSIRYGRNSSWSTSLQRARDALAAKKAQGVKPGGLNAKGIANREEALVRAERLRPLFVERAGMSHRKMAAELKPAKIRHWPAANGIP